MRQIRLADGHLGVRDEGRGHPLLLVHGFPLDHTMWQEQIAAFAPSHRVIAPDLRGFGTSPVSPGVADMEQFADDLAALLDGLQIAEPVTLCGLSMGGYIAWQFWRRHRARLARLILCDTRAAADTPAAAAQRLESAQRVVSEGTGFLVESMLGKLLAEATGDNRPELVTRLRQMMQAAPAAGVAAALRGMAARSDATDWLPEIDVPALVLCGRYDAITPLDEMRTVAGRLARGRFAEISSAGHMAPLENPAEVNQAIGEFLATPAAAG